ncbi:MAG: GAF domain-containing protein [bacterium]|nr:GAF domain-containing protein [bacterium]
MTTRPAIPRERSDAERALGRARLALWRLERTILARDERIRGAVDAVAVAAAELGHADAVVLSLAGGAQRTIASAGLRPALRDPADPPDAAVAYAVPVASHGRTLGVLWVGRERHYPFTARELERMGVLAEALALALVRSDPEV